MIIIARQFYNFIKKDKIRRILAFLFYILFILIFIVGLNLPFILQIPFHLTFITVSILGIAICIIDLSNKIHNKENVNMFSIVVKLYKIEVELCMALPIYVLHLLILYFFMLGEPANQTALNARDQQFPIFSFISSIIIAPIKEELIFRLLPSKFINNKILFIIVSSVVFAGIHVIHDPNPFYYIWFYMIVSLYLGFRYYKTKDILVTISIHSYFNLLAHLI